jgi:hypothetical protein
MRFTEHELTVALTGAAKSVLAAEDKGVRKRKRDIDDVWRDLPPFGRFQLLDGLGDQLLPVLVALPDVEVEAGARPVFTDAQITAAVEERMGDERGVRRKVLVKARVALVKVALQHVPPRSDPDALTVSDGV